ncbi:MAG TPA: phosphoribosyltransferase family protein [Anaerolineae bacterium]|jgi:putative phosphoribosyl transferase
MLFRDRCDAGQQLAARLAFLKDQPNVIVLGIPRGGVVVAAEVARALNAPLDIFIAHKIGASFNPELAIGALTSNGELVRDEDLIDELRLSEKDIAREVEYQRGEIARRLALFRGKLSPLDVAEKTVILVDDGVATGSTVLAALRALRKQSPARVILAIPVGPADTVARLARECDQTVVLATPEPFWAVGRFYMRFDQTQDEEVVRLLEEVARRMETRSTPS